MGANANEVSFDCSLRGWGFLLLVKYVIKLGLFSRLTVKCGNVVWCRGE